MNWLTNFIRPKIRSFVSKQDVPDNLWYKCPACEAMLFHRDLTQNQNVCYHCNHHMKISVETRLTAMFDDGAFETLDLPKVPSDPLKFRDKKKYSDRLKEHQNRSGYKDALVIAKGTIGGQRAVIAAMNFDFMGGSMGAAVGSGILKAAKLAVDENAAFITIPASGGARMQEGAISLMQMPRTVLAVKMIKDAGLPYIVILTNPTTGGVSASFAMIGDVHIAEPGATIGFAGKRVIQETIREELPDDFQTSEYLLDHGMVDLVVSRSDIPAQVGKLLNLLMNKKHKAGSKGKNSGGSNSQSGGDGSKSSKPSNPEKALRSYQGAGRQEAANSNATLNAAADGKLYTQSGRPNVFLAKIMTDNFRTRLGTVRIKIDPANNNMRFSLDNDMKMTSARAVQ